MNAISSSFEGMRGGFIGHSWAVSLAGWPLSAELFGSLSWRLLARRFRGAWPFGGARFDVVRGSRRRAFCLAWPRARRRPTAISPRVDQHHSFFERDVLRRLVGRQ